MVVDPRAASSFACAQFSRELSPFAAKYQPVRMLGRGGMGLVFEARHLRVGGLHCAIKLLPANLCGHPELVTRFEREAAAASALTSVHAVKVFDYDVADDGRPFLVMELLQGKDLEGVLDAEGVQPVSRAVEWIMQACDALAEAHDRGIVHRDIKPSNLFLADVGGKKLIKVLDFGIAKTPPPSEQPARASLTQPTCPLGTPQYMAPEQIRCASAVDARSDVWALGITLYELVTGTTPFAGYEEPLAAIVAIASEELPDPRVEVPDLPDAFVNVLLTALRKDPAERFPSARDFARALEPFAASAPRGTRGTPCELESSLAAPPALREGFVPRPPPRVRPWAVACAAAVGLLAWVVGIHVAPEAPRPGAHRTTLVPPVRVPPAVRSAPAELPPRDQAGSVPVLAAESPLPLPRRIVGKRAPVAPPPTLPTAASERLPRRPRSAVIHGGLSGPGF
jgi:serine/threonine-protein kinase